MKFLILFGLVASALSYEFKTTWFTTKVDHFGYANNDTYCMRVLYNDDNFDQNNPGPIFFYTGNEGDIESFAQNTGIMWDWAKEFKALLVFAEHRFYGKSLPYGQKSFKDPKYYGYLTVDQAMADYADFLDNMKKTWPGTASSKIVAFGGSYGGMLSAWMRIRYPWIINAALAGSAPILQFQDITPCETYNQIVTRAFSVDNKYCPYNIRKSWSIVEKMASTPAGATKIGEIFKFCKALTPANATAVRDWLSETYSDLAMMNYPYSTSFMKKVPGHPVKIACSYLNQTFKSDEALLGALYKAVSVFHNFTGETKCNDLGNPDGDNISGSGWDIQTCNEMVMPMCADGKKDMFYDYTFNFTAYRLNCEEKYGMTPDLYKAYTMFGGNRISSATNIIFSNGDVDPWSGGGVLKDLSPSLPVILIPGGAHHYDLRGAHPEDTPAVIAARNVEKEYIKKWISDF